MNLPRYAVLAARLLKRDFEPTASRGDRARGLLTIERAMRVRARRRLALWGLGGVAAAAAALLIGHHSTRAGSALPVAALADVTPLGSGANVRTNGRVLPLLAQTSLVAGSTVETASAGGATLQLPSRSSLLLERATALRLVGGPQTQRFALERGALSAHVAKLELGKRFIVDTPDAEVEVRGTRFALRILERPEQCGLGSRTRLEVSEGVVEVRASGVVSRVTAGQSWPAGCATTEAATANRGSAVSRPAPAEPVATAPPKPMERSSSQPTHGGASALTQQNDLFAAGVALRRQGDVAGALRAYQDLIVQFPNSPLAENAMVERMRLLATTQRALAEEEARRYVRRYPRGFALDEAERLTDAP